MNIYKDFPCLNQNINGQKLIYFDNAATTQKPNIVIESMSEFYRKYMANVHRSSHTLGSIATNKYENARENIRKFINANNKNEIIFTKGTTEGINLLSTCLSKKIKENDEILISQMEHHSNILPWQQVCKYKKSILKTIPFNNNGDIILSTLKSILNEKTKIVSLVHVSNVLGTINPIKEIIKVIRNYNDKIIIIIDGCQAIAHMKIDVIDIDCDFYIFSGHKMYGPTGIGVLYGKEKILEDLDPYQFGGDMVKYVSFEKSEFDILPYKFEAGTPNIVGAIGLSEAIDYIKNLNFDEIKLYENNLLKYCMEKISNISKINFIGKSLNKNPIISFYINDISSYDISLLLDTYGVSIRSGQHCAQPLLNVYGLDSVARVSLAIYNTEEEIDIFYNSLVNTIKTLI
jgi:cysteine desulfurase/selenocysteine lyase